MRSAKNDLPFQDRVAVTVGDAWRYYSIGKSKLYELMDAGHLQFVKIGKRRLILRESLDKLITPTT
jgi:excisionase family DNA binding protein